MSDQLKTQVLGAIDLIWANSPERYRDAQKLRIAVNRDIDNPLIAKRLGILFDNASNDNPFSQEDARAVGTALSDIHRHYENIARRRGRPKEFSGRLETRISDEESDALDAIAEQTGEDRSEIVRRLIREAGLPPHV